MIKVKDKLMSIDISIPKDIIINAINNHPIGKINIINKGEFFDYLVENLVDFGIDGFDRDRGSVLTNLLDDMIEKAAIDGNGIEYVDIE